MPKGDATEGAEIIPLFTADERWQPSPAESLRLLRAFLAIADPVQRRRAIEWVERLAAGNGQDAS